MNLDFCPSIGRLDVTTQGKELIWSMRVAGLGFLTIRATSDPATGRMSYDAMSVIEKTPQ